MTLLHMSNTYSAPLFSTILGFSVHFHILNPMYASLSQMKLKSFHVASHVWRVYRSHVFLTVRSEIPESRLHCINNKLEYAATS